MNKSVFYKLSYGLYVITSGKEGKFNGQIANTVFQVTSEPPTLAVSINKLNFTHEHIRESRRFAVSILGETAPMTMIGQFGFKCGRDINKFEGIRVRTGKTGVPIVADHAVAFIEAEVVGEMDCGTHTIFLGQVVECDILDAAAEPMTYAYYHKVKGGKAPKTAPTYQKEEPPQPAAPAVKAALHLLDLRLHLRPGKGRPGGEYKTGNPLRGSPCRLGLSRLRRGEGQVRQGGLTRRLGNL